VERELAERYAAQDWVAFLRLAVRARKNIVVSGATGSGKTTLTKALVREIPGEERLVAIEDTAELSLDGHGNSVRLLYSKEGQGLARVSAKQLLEASLRMRPCRILLAELRGEEAYYYLRNVNSGHPGSITSVHASSAQLAFEQLTLLVKESPAGREMARGDVRALLDQLVDVVVQCGVEGQRRFVKEVYWKDGHSAAP
jgi:type IV secretion system protein VirB11